MLIHEIDMLFKSEINRFVEATNVTRVHRSRVVKSQYINGHSDAQLWWYRWGRMGSSMQTLTNYSGANYDVAPC